MQLVSAIKMRKAQTVAIEGRPYRQTLEDIISKVMGSLDITASQLVATPDTNAQKNLIIFVSSNKGLCGAFNLNLQRYLVRNLDYKVADFITLGKKGAMFIGSLKKAIIADFSSKNPTAEVSAVFELAITKFLAGEYRHVYLVYSKFISTLRNETVSELLLPFDVPSAQFDKDSQSNYLIEPQDERMIDQLLKSYLEEKIRGAVMSSEAVEHSSRMIAMKNATDNATDVIYSLTLLSNKLRQTKITYELLDMVTAKESVENNN